MQGIFPLEETTSGIRLTTAKFFSPSGHPYSGVGVEPDVRVPRVPLAAKPIDGSAVPASSAENPILTAALQTIRADEPVAGPASPQLAVTLAAASVPCFPV